MSTPTRTIHHRRLPAIRFMRCRRRPDYDSAFLRCALHPRETCQARLPGPYQIKQDRSVRRADELAPAPLFREPRPRRSRRLGRRRLKIEGQPDVPARRPICIVEFAVGLQVQISLHVSDRKDVADLRSDADHPRLEATDAIAGAAVAADLLI